MFNISQFDCAWCTRGHEVFHRLAPEWRQVVTTALANLHLNQPTPPPFVAKDAVTTYIDRHWNSLCAGLDQTPSWFESVCTNIYESPDLYEWYARQILLCS